MFLRENQEEVVSPEAMKFIKHQPKIAQSIIFLDKRFQVQF